MLKIQEYVNIASYTTFQLSAQARYFTVLTEKQYIAEIVLKAKNDFKIPLYFLGSGSNTIFGTTTVNKFIVVSQIKGFSVITEDENNISIQIGAGENWDDIVARTVEMNLSGIEAMSAIPGTVGATPVQNVGAYGQEIKDTLVSVECYDMNTDSYVTISNTECQFGYRESIFKSSQKGRYVILSITLQLSKKSPKMPEYPGVKAYFIERNIEHPTLQQIRDTIIEIRKSKLPNPTVVKNCGSFFKNPIVEKNVADELQNKYPDIKVFPVDDEKIKIPAGWLIEQAGLKGSTFGPISVYDKNALVLVNNGTNTTIDDLKNAIDKIVSIVREKFGITLEAEPNIVK